MDQETLCAGLRQDQSMSSEIPSSAAAIQLPILSSLCIRPSSNRLMDPLQHRRSVQAYIPR